MEAKKGAKFSCKVTARDGATIDVRIEQTNAKGDFSLHVDPTTLRTP